MLVDATYNFHSRKAASSFLKGTRIALLQKICEWIYSKNLEQHRRLYLYGLSGTGKSTIAETVARYCAKGGSLGATFFFAREYNDRGDAVRVFPTKAYQLAQPTPSFWHKLANAVQATLEAYRWGLLEQLTNFILEPLHDVIGAPSPFIFVFDSLDDCGDASDARELLRLLTYAIKELPPT